MCTSVVKKQVVLPIFTKWHPGILLRHHDSNLDFCYLEYLGLLVTFILMSFSILSS